MTNNVERTGEVNPLQVAINVTRELYYLSQIPRAEAELVESRLQQFLDLKHRFSYQQIISQRRDLNWLLENGRIDRATNDQQEKDVAMREWYSLSLGGVDFDEMRIRRELPDFILNAVQRVNNNRLFFEELQQSRLQILDLPVKTDRLLELPAVEAASSTANALLPARIDLKKPDGLVRFKYEDVRTALNRVARLVYLDGYDLKVDGLRELRGSDAYNTLLAMLMQYHFILEKEIDKNHLAVGRMTGTASLLFLGIGGMSFSAGAQFLLSGDTSPGMLLAIGSALPGTMGLGFLGLTYLNTERVGIRRLLGLAPGLKKNQLEKQ